MYHYDKVHVLIWVTKGVDNMYKVKHIHTQDPDSQLLYAQNLFCFQLQYKTSQNQYNSILFIVLKMPFKNIEGQDN